MGGEISDRAQTGRSANHNPLRSEAANHLSSKTNQRIGVPYQSADFDFYLKTGLLVRQSNAHSFEYHLLAFGKDTNLFETAATKNGLNEAETEVGKLIAEKERELSRKYHVDFSTSADEVPPYIIGTSTKCRAPDLGELAAIQSALEKRPRSEGTLIGSPAPKLYFLTKDNSAGTALGYYSLIGERPAIVFEPESLHGKPPTDLDKADWYGKGLSYSGSSAEFIVAHELAHHDQATLAQVDQTNEVSLPEGLQTSQRKTTDFSRRRSDFAERQQYESIGWKLVKSNINGTFVDQWMLRGKDGFLYRHNGEVTEEGSWTRCNDDGHPVNEKGQISFFARGYTITRQQMVENAVVRPITTYFSNPAEMQAEGLSAFRSGKEGRAVLLQRSDLLYQAMRTADQEQIDAKCPPRHGQDSVLIRSPDGELVVNNEDNRRVIAEFEAKCKERSHSL